MRALVTGAAGFIGSHLCESLLSQGHDVLGVDCFTDYYHRALKEQNVRDVSGRTSFDFRELDLRTADLASLLADVSVVYHQAAQAGVRSSWGDGFPSYVEHNINATQRLLEACRGAGVSRFVYASSSSVYGRAPRYPTDEQDSTRPYSPYGVTKLAGENIVTLYGQNFGLPTVSLRYHTVYGPRQRPDMAIHRIIESCLAGSPFELFGAGEYVRDFTYVGDVVAANVAAGKADVPPGAVYNIAGGSSIRMNELVASVEHLTDRKAVVVHREAAVGDVPITGGSVALARIELAWEPQVDLEKGLLEQIMWHRQLPRGS